MERPQIRIWRVKAGRPERGYFLLSYCSHHCYSSNGASPLQGPLVPVSSTPKTSVINPIPRDTSNNQADPLQTSEIQQHKGSSSEFWKYWHQRSEFQLYNASPPSLGRDNPKGFPCFETQPSLSVVATSSVYLLCYFTVPFCFLLLQQLLNQSFILNFVQIICGFYFPNWTLTDKYSKQPKFSKHWPSRITCQCELIIHLLPPQLSQSQKELLWIFTPTILIPLPSRVSHASARIGKEYPPNFPSTTY